MADSTEKPRKPKATEINPLLIDWIEDYKLDWQSTTEFVHQLLYEALLNYGRSRNDLTRVPRLGGTATPDRNTSLRSALACEEINFPTRKQPGSAVDPPVAIPPDLQGGGAVPSNAREKKKVQYTDGFNAFWKLYQSAPKKASGQSKSPLSRNGKGFVHEEAQRIIDATGNCIRPAAAHPT